MISTVVCKSRYYKLPFLIMVKNFVSSKQKLCLVFISNCAWLSYGPLAKKYQFCLKPALRQISWYQPTKRWVHSIESIEKVQDTYAHNVRPGIISTLPANIFFIWVIKYRFTENKYWEMNKKRIGNNWNGNMARLQF